MVTRCGGGRHGDPPCTLPVAVAWDNCGYRAHHCIGHAVSMAELAEGRAPDLVAGIAAYWAAQADRPTCWAIILEEDK